MRCTPSEVHAYETHAHEVHVHKVHTYEVRAHEVHAHDLHAHEGFYEDLARQNTVACRFQRPSALFQPVCLSPLRHISVDLIS
jgi:hypothetical protein